MKGNARLSEAIGRLSRLSEARWSQRPGLARQIGVAPGLRGNVVAASRLSEAMWGRSMLSGAIGRSPGLARQCGRSRLSEAKWSLQAWQG